MLFNSYTFIFVFLPVTLLIYFWLGSVAYHRVAITWLVASSIFFYGWWNPSYVPLIMFSILFNYAFGLELSRSIKTSKPRAKLVLFIGIGTNLSLLGYYKYANFLIENINLLADTQLTLNKIILPLAISFYTFTQIAYLVDAYRGETKEYNFLHYTLFVLFFPHLIAGPIVHHRDLIPQFSNSKIFRPQALELSIGITIFFVGLFKKIVIADAMALHATPVFNNAELGMALSFVQAWKGALAYTFQLYFDFSGYSDMAIGSARMFGIILPFNFNSPYKSASIIEFWRRWHITLSLFLRDYLYFLLGGNRKGTIRRYINLMITMVLGGLWHGASWTFIVWGSLHGLYLIVNNLWRLIFPLEPRSIFLIFSYRVLTMLCIIAGWVFFRAQTFHGALSILHGMMNLPSALDGHLGPIQATLELVGFNFKGGYLSWDDYKIFGWGLFWILVMGYWPNTQEWIYNSTLKNENSISTNLLSVKLKIFRWQPTVLWGAIIAIIAILGILGLSSVTEFLYFQF